MGLAGPPNVTILTAEPDRDKGNGAALGEVVKATSLRAFNIERSVNSIARWTWKRPPRGGKLNRSLSSRRLFKDLHLRAPALRENEPSHASRLKGCPFSMEVCVMRGRTLFLCLLAFSLAVVPLPGQVTAGKPPAGSEGKGKLERQEEWDEVVAWFIRFEIGQLKREEAKLSTKDFHNSLARLDARAIPALVRGVNRAALENYSCPYMMFAAKLSALLSLTDDRKLVGYAVEHLGEGVTNREYLHKLDLLRGEAQRRLVAIVEGKLTARDLAVRQLYSQREAAVRIALKAENADVRWAAVRIAARGTGTCTWK
jgi:hypothetical protein